MSIMSKTPIAKPVQNVTIPRPGEIWELSSSEATKNHDSRDCLATDELLRYVMIVRIKSVSDSEPFRLSAMFLSLEINSVSARNILIPREISGLSSPIVAQTWNIEWIAAQSLRYVAGKRLSRPIYEIFLAIGNYYHGLIDIEPSIQQIRDLGLEAVGDDERTDISSSYMNLISPAVFHQTNTILETVIQAERKWIASSQPSITSRINLGQWFHTQIEAGWQALNDFRSTRPLTPILAIRSLDPDPGSVASDNEIQAVLDRLSNAQDKIQVRMLIQQLRELIHNSSDTSQSRAIHTLAILTQNTQDDEILWLLIQTLWTFDPHHPAAGTRRIKLLDLGINCAGHPISLLVAIARKANQQLAVLLQVHPADGETYLPASLKLKLLDEAGRTIQEVIARQSDIYLQFKFSGNSEEKFSVAIELGAVTIVENFTL
jgi:hypothetical protein